MKKILTLMISGLFSLCVFAQDADVDEQIECGKFRFGVTFGTNFATTLDSYDDHSVESGFKSCLQGGLTGSVRADKKNMISLALLLVEKGAKPKDSKSNLSKLYFQLNASYRYYFVAKPSFGFFLEGGTYFALGWKSRSSYDGVVLDLYDGDNERRFDCGYRLGLGMDFGKHLTLNAGLECGFINLAKADKTKSSNLIIPISLIYTF